MHMSEFDFLISKQPLHVHVHAWPIWRVFGLSCGHCYMSNGQIECSSKPCQYALLHYMQGTMWDNLALYKTSTRLTF